VADEVGDVELRVSCGKGFWLSVSGRLLEALAELELSMELSRDHPEMGRAVTGFSVYPWAQQFVGYALLPQLGRFAEGRQAIETGLAMAHEYGDVESVTWAHMGIAYWSWYAGEAGDALQHARIAVESAERQGANMTLALTQNSLALAHLVRGEWSEADEAAQRGLEIIRESHTGVQYLGWMYCTRAQAAWRGGDPLAAVSLAEEAVTLLSAHKMRTIELDARLSLAQALIRAGLLDRAEAELQRLEALITATSSVPHGAWLEAERGELALRRDDRAGYERHLAEARRRFEEMGAHGWAERFGAQLAALHA
jgi:tetratricopeptide (TPR) repeat protein